MKCECGFIFSGPGEYRDYELYIDKYNRWWAICPKCGKEYESD